MEIAGWPPLATVARAEPVFVLVKPCIDALQWAVHAEALGAGEICLNSIDADGTKDGYEIRRAAIKYSIPYATTIAGASAMCQGIAALIEQKITVKTVQEYNAEMQK